MLDKFERAITYLRISVTGRCNMRCFYCRPGGGGEPGEPGLPAGDIVRIVRAGTRVGIRKIRLTGGEPLVRPDIVSLTAALSALPGIDDIALTTNGALLARYAQELKEAGLRRVNISLDTLRPERFTSITRAGRWQDVWSGVEAALVHDFSPVKLNVVVLRGHNEDEVADFARLAREYPLHVRFIELMPIGEGSAFTSELYVSADEIWGRLRDYAGALEPVGSVGGSGPARYWKLPGGRGTIGLIAPLSGYFCPSCNRMRLTAAGTLRPCLCQGEEIDVKPLLARGAGDDELAALMTRAIAAKPKGNPEHEIAPVTDRLMSQIGG
ncbi:MAG: GTP 3',8-cyclase MoaA [Thermoanaerobacterales bacterium]|nr:GTP 3',8-cyclase MoaA [Bacillota bacterium]MDI6907807.1 GTP 3',8-cyclase MoaA [Thermoanaerobacterales bacterium]